MHLSRDQRIENLKAITKAVPQIIEQYHALEKEPVINPDYFIEQVLGHNLSDLINQLIAQETIDFKVEEIDDIINHICLVHQEIIRILNEEEFNGALSYLENLRRELSHEELSLGTSFDTKIQLLREEIDEIDNRIADLFITLLEQETAPATHPQILQLLAARREVVEQIAEWKYKAGYSVMEIRDLSREFYIIHRLRSWLGKRWHDALEDFYIKQVFTQSNDLQRNFFVKNTKK